jgi:nitrogen-specific signal transduction histidine kinase
VAGTAVGVLTQRPRLAPSQIVVHGPKSDLGLGLYIDIAYEIARAHGGTIDVASTPAETRFTFRMPLS